ncbi:SDR family oxidoreductase [Sphingomonas lutea]|uniref:SDR family oxidoreductase n=1 Tax=Sphingomonas lutea TaxID=1045317 RepID=A0A7G9SI43_9SPHN|nr:SDR family oxidoreductase [Sphingomonas lutea]QNN67518.1 SDR family oxidoreductase [Sphingomonas lutea]
MTPVTVITGASAGLGVEFARQLAGRGQKLVLVARREDRIAALAAELGNARAVAIDLSEPDAAARLMADIEAAGEQVDTLINNAGFGLWGRFASQDPRRLREMIDLNIATLTDLCRAVAPGMIERRRGAILNVASTAAFQAGPGMAVYFATKAYVLSLSEALHEELRPHGIKVSCLCPGPTRTEFGDVAGFGNRLGKAFERISMTADDVVAKGIAALEANRAVAVTGVTNKIGAQATRFLPRSWLRRIAGAIKD